MKHMTRDFVLTENASPGVWEVRTWSGSTYRIRIDPDRALEVTRFAESSSLQHDGELMPGVGSFTFENGRGGTIQWWRDPHERDEPTLDAAYIATFRNTSEVTAITYLEGLSEQ